MSHDCCADPTCGYLDCIEARGVAPVCAACGGRIPSRSAFVSGGSTRKPRNYHVACAPDGPNVRNVHVMAVERPKPRRRGRAQCIPPGELLSPFATS